jgi:hypothetical protein
MSSHAAKQREFDTKLIDYHAKIEEVIKTLKGLTVIEAETVLFNAIQEIKNKAVL